MLIYLRDAWELITPVQLCHLYLFLDKIRTKNNPTELVRCSHTSNKYLPLKPEGCPANKYFIRPADKQPHQTYNTLFLRVSEQNL